MGTIKQCSESDAKDAICIGENVPVVFGGVTALINRLFVTSNGGILVKTNGDPNHISTVMKMWSMDTLDRIAEDYFYGQRGQAYLVIDEMAEQGLLSYSDETVFSRRINQTLADGSVTFLTEACDGTK